MSLNTTLLSETFQRAKQENGGATALGLRFYERLFETYPAVRPLFHTPPEEQHKKLMVSISAIVAGASRPDTLIPYLHAMGIRHLKYGAKDAHYAAVAENLLAVLQEHLSVEGEWTDAMRTTWSDALNLISRIMIEAASTPEKYQEELRQNGFQADGFRYDQSAPWLSANISPN